LAKEKEREVIMFEVISKNWRTSLFGLCLVVVGVYVLLRHGEQIELAIGLILSGLGQLFAKDGATKSEYLKEKEEIKHEVLCEAERRVRALTIDELRAELERRTSAK
jgi:hypothetical protein